MQTLLESYSARDVKNEPFPHLIVRNALPQDLYDALASEFPAGDVICDGKDPGDNKRFDYTIKQVREKDRVGSLWREFIETQAGEAFWADIARILGPSALDRYPELGDLATMKIGTRYVDDAREKDILLDAHISINTPVVSAASSVRTAHIDDPLKLYSGLFYMRTAEDDSEGGDLILYEYRGEKRPFYGQQIQGRYVREANRVPYEANTLIVFLNTPESLHGVTPRKPTRHTRRFVNLVGELGKPLYDLGAMQENIWLRRLRTYGGHWFQRGYESR